MSTLTMALVQDALNEFYLPGLQYQLNDQASLLLAQLERNEKDVEGKNIVMALRYGRNGGIGMRAEDGDLPTPSSRKTKQAKWETKNMAARFAITEKTIKASRSDTGSFARLLEQEIADVETDVKQDLSRQVIGNGTGLLATITVVAGTTLTVNSTMHLAEGMRIDVFQGTTNTVRIGGIVVEAVDDAESPLRITVSSATGILANDTIFVAGSKDLEITGLDAIFTAANLYGMVRNDFPVLKATRTNVAGEISETRIQRAIDEAERKAGAKINFLYCSYGVRRAYQNLQTLMKRHVNSVDLKGGWKALDYNGMPLAADKYIAAGKLYCLDLNDFALYSMGDFEWLERDGAMLNRIANKAAWEATMIRFCDIGCAKPRGQVELFGITEH